MRTAGTTHSKGFTLVELILTVVIAAIPIFAIGTLLVGAQKGWQDSYNAVHKEIQQDALATMTTFGSIGRQSNRSNYKVYRIFKGSFIEAVPKVGETLATGQAVEMHYWRDPAASLDLEVLEITNTGTHFALFYLEGDELKVDFGDVIDGIGAVSGGLRTARSVETQVLAHYVDTSHDEIFSHTVISGKGQGSVRMNLILEDDDGQRVEVKTATLLRVVWPQ
ncbi:MAG: prepilin-type N-terminal cleavage/methylation domain-containing protein [Sedimentisphaerales bacterium]|nr:prepilin-type N-terminal cleavage/methylation domain-containing protein [Sedimentisphaerales bacterium]